MNAALVVMSLASLFGGRAVDLAALDPPPGATEVARPAEAVALDALARAHVAGAKFDRARFFRTPADVSWQPVIKLLETGPAMRGLKRLDDPAARPGLDLVQGWTGGGGRGVVVAMIASRGAPGTVAYYTVTLPR